ncbi:ydhD [Wigglesworthia glossinidia endosymbiont of Glossina brevipalpis]|uniref:Glutaredoxin n=1 Tax=Wigglesworthia glossinidia brevipalpis TaxID=36870 RepID=Q8D2M0_WIGBR|nr:ydhD [Wigglesworthia glossinidia endosymbiont of Glossina brevipalpis]
MKNSIEKIKEQIKKNKIILYMKGSPENPKCGFSSKVARILCESNFRFAYVDVISNPHIREKLPEFSNWPTFPQLWVNGSLVGGCDIVTKMHEKGELVPFINKEINK